MGIFLTRLNTTGEGPHPLSPPQTHPYAKQSAGTWQSLYKFIQKWTLGHLGDAGPGFHPVTASKAMGKARRSAERPPGGCMERWKGRCHRLVTQKPSSMPLSLDF